jgi:3D (Asp-Asp-Asp) domain-containing protein
MTKALRFLTIGLTLLAVGCSENGERGKSSESGSKGPVGERKIVKTTAYTDSESGHRAYGIKNAIGSCLQSGSLNSAAADWSRFPIGTKFRIVENNQTYVIDDYGPALVGTDTIDLYVPSIRLMNQWGAKHVTIEVLQKGSYEKSLEVLEPRQGNRCVRQMVQNIRKQNETRF